MQRSKIRSALFFILLRLLRGKLLLIKCGEWRPLRLGLQIECRERLLWWLLLLWWGCGRLLRLHSKGLLLLDSELSLRLLWLRSKLLRLLWRLLKPDGLKTIRVHRHGSSEGRLLGWKLLKYWLRLRQRPSKWIESCGELVETIEEWREERACNKAERSLKDLSVKFRGWHPRRFSSHKSTGYSCVPTFVRSYDQSVSKIL